MRCFLEFVLEETLAGHASELCEYSIATSGFERDQSFELDLDPIVRNDARRLRQKLHEYYERSKCENGNQVVIEILRGSYVPVFSSGSRRQLSRAGRHIGRPSV